MPNSGITVENAWLRYEVGPDGRTRQFTDKGTGVNYADAAARSPFARVRANGREYPATEVALADGRLHVRFGDSGVHVRLRMESRARHIAVEVESLEGQGVVELAFLDVPLTLQGKRGEAFAGCILALNLQTRVDSLPGPCSRLTAACYPRFGFRGAQAAMIGCPPDMLRDMMKDVVAAATDLPHSPLGGPWALDAPICRGSYLFDFGDVTEATVDEWIRLAKSLGFTQIDFHGGRSFRFGDCRPDPQRFPRGIASLKAVIDRLHDAGIAAGLHPYAFFIDKRCPWVTPVPDPRLARAATFTLSSALGNTEDIVPVAEPTESVSAVTGFFVRNSVTLQIDDELITYKDVARKPPYGFSRCQRGALGSRSACHRPGTPVHHLKECFGLFAPDGDSSLLSEVAERTAEAYNDCGFDMMYLDALDGEDVLGGPENAWHYGSKFVFELWRRLRKPAVMEMSTFHHHLWFVRSRMGAWDHPHRSHKTFIDLHVRDNESCERMFLPPHLGWWAALHWDGVRQEPTFPDDMEYLCCKSLGTDAGLSLMGVKPEALGTNPALERLARIICRYEALRHSGRVPATLKERLRQPGAEFTLAGDPAGQWAFQPVTYGQHKVTTLEPSSRGWTVHNPFGPQPLRLRIEALMSAAPYQAAGNIPLLAERAPRAGMELAAAPGVETWLDLSPECRDETEPCLRYAARSQRDSRDGAWARARRVFSPPIDLSQHQGMGVWIRGDGQGELLNLQLTSPEHMTWEIGEHYVDIDFTGWRYFELIEPEGARFNECAWPYGSPYMIYRGSVRHSHVEALTLWFNRLPPNGTVQCLLAPVKAIPLTESTLRNPAITVGDETIRFPVDMPSGTYLEFHSTLDCRLYGPKGELLREVPPAGGTPMLVPGENRVRFDSDAVAGVGPRAQVTVITSGEPIVQ